MKRNLLLLFIILSGIHHANAQQGLPLDSLSARADRFYLSRNYDSSIAYCVMIIMKVKDMKERGEYEFLKAAGAMITAGHCYDEKGIYTEAHKYFQYALRQSRALESSVDITNAFIALNQLHEKISKQNIDFPYPAVTVTEEVSMFFPITKVEAVSKDSLKLTIRAGYYDGLTDSVEKGGIISKYTKPERPFGLVNAHLRQIGNNYTIAMAVNDSMLKVMEGDLVELKVRVPLSWRRLDINQALLYAIYFRDNYKQPLFAPRFLYYYSDSLSNGEIGQAMKLNVDEIVSNLGEDTLTDKQFQQRADKGIFAGDNVIKGMSRVNAEYLRLFLGFVNEYPRKYIGIPFTFSDVYATWVINNTPLATAAVKPFLISRRSDPKRNILIGNLSDDIKSKNLIDNWFNEGMLMANADNLDSAAYIAQLINNTSMVLKDDLKKGWGSYLQAYVEKKLGNYTGADSLFRSAFKEFKAAKNKEGMDWAESALKNLDKGRKVELSVQTGHLFPYLMSTSPNSKYLVTAGNYDKLIKIWDLALGKEVTSFTGHSEYITSLQYSPNGRYIVSAAEDTTIKIWNAYDYSLVRTIKTKNVKRIVIFTPDSKQLVAGGNDSLVSFMDPITGTVTRSLKKHKAAVTGLAFSPVYKDQFFSSGSDSLIYKWDLSTGDWDHWYKEKGRVLTIAVSNDGNYLCSVHSDTAASVWNLRTNRKYFTIRPNYSVSGGIDIAYPAFTPDSKYLAFALTNDTLDMVELSTLKERVYGTKIPKGTGLYDLSFTPDGNFLVSRFNNGGPIRVFNFSSWDFNSRPTINFKDLKNYYNLPTEVQFSRDDNRLFVVHEGVSSIDLRNGSTQFLYFGALGFANPYIIMNDENIGLYTDTKLAYLKFFDHANIEKKLEISLPDPLEEMSRFELSADNKYVFLGGNNNTVAGFELPSGKALFSKTYESGPEKGWITIRYDSIRHRLFLIGSSDKVIVADAMTGKEIAQIKVKGAYSAEVSPAFIYISGDKSIVYKFDAKTLKLLKLIKVHESGKGCYATALSHNYKVLLVQVADEFAAIDTKTDKVLYHKHDHEYDNGVMNISHNDKMLATGGR